MSTQFTRRKFIATTALACVAGRVQLDAAETECKPFRFHIEEALLDDLRARLARTRWPE
jgi:hypothetical protein